jgi:sulfatase maturation enzyme AslB (radical SAM superfamily)
MIPKESLLDIFGTARDLGILGIGVVGDGEPSIHPNIYEALELGHKKGLDIGFATNGIALDKEKIKILLTTCTWLRFNLSAAEKEAYKFIHGVDAWEKVKANILLTLELRKEMKCNTTIGLQMVLTPEEIQQVIPEAKFAIESQVDYFVIKQYSQPGCEDMSDFDLNWYDKPETIEILKKAESMSNEITAIIPKWKIIGTKGKRKYDRCVDCALLFQISGNSKGYPCGHLFGNEKYCYGDLKKQTLKEILDSEKYWEIVKYMREKFNVHTDCAGCCRHDSTNEFIWNYLNKPQHLSFI